MVMKSGEHVRSSFSDQIDRLANETLLRYSIPFSARNVRKETVHSKPLIQECRSVWSGKKQPDLAAAFLLRMTDRLVREGEYCRFEFDLLLSPPALQ